MQGEWIEMTTMRRPRSTQSLPHETSSFIERYRGQPLVRRTPERPMTQGDALWRRVYDMAIRLVRHMYEQFHVRHHLNFVIEHILHYGYDQTFDQLSEFSEYMSAENLMENVHTQTDMPTIDDLKIQEMIEKVEKMALENKKTKTTFDADVTIRNFEVEAMEVSVEQAHIETEIKTKHITKADLDNIYLDEQIEKVKIEREQLRLQNEQTELETSLIQEEYGSKLLKMAIERTYMEKEFEILNRDVNILDAYAYLCTQMIGQQISPKHEMSCALIIRNYFEKNKITNNMSILQSTKIILAMYAMDEKFAMTTYFDWRNDVSADDVAKTWQDTKKKRKPYNIIRTMNEINKTRAGKATKKWFCGLFSKSIELQHF